MCQRSDPHPPRLRGLFPLSVAAVFMLASANAAQPVFGLVIGDALTLAECSRLAMPAVRNFEPPYAPITSPCTKSRGDGGFIAFPPGQQPQHMVGGQLGYRLIDGKLAVLFGTTAGAPVQRAVMADLEAKFGQASQRADETVTTSAGAVLPAVRAIWKTPTMRVEYLGVAGRADAGELVFGTEAGLAAFRDEQRRVGASRQTPM